MNPFTDLITRLGLDEPRAAQYLGVPVYTLRKWIKNERTPSAAVLRLIEVLGVIEALAPAIHDALVPVAHVEKVRMKSDAHVDKVRAKPKRHVEKVPASPSLT
jgi:transcriptional regulator with XRE-family HTH domain